MGSGEIPNELGDVYKRQEDKTGQTDSKAGDWTLSVKADGPLSLKDDNGADTGKTIDNATLTMLNTAYGQTGNVYGLTNESQDDGFTPVGALVPLTDISKTTTMTLSGTDTNHQVAHAATGEGEGANVFGWDKTNIKLVLPKTSVVNNGKMCIRDRLSIVKSCVRLR